MQTRLLLAYSAPWRNREWLAKRNNQSAQEPGMRAHVQTLMDRENLYWRVRRHTFFSSQDISPIIFVWVSFKLANPTVKLSRLTFVLISNLTKPLHFSLFYSTPKDPAAKLDTQHMDAAILRKQKYKDYCVFLDQFGQNLTCSRSILGVFEPLARVIVLFV